MDYADIVTHLEAKGLQANLKRGDITLNKDYANTCLAIDIAQMDGVSPDTIVPMVTELQKNQPELFEVESLPSEFQPTPPQPDFFNAFDTED